MQQRHSAFVHLPNVRFYRLSQIRCHTVECLRIMLTVYNMQPNDDVRIGEMPHQLILYEIVDIELTFSM